MCESLKLSMILANRAAVVARRFDNPILKDGAQKRNSKSIS